MIGDAQPVPLEIKGEERIFGGKLSLRQAGYLFAGGTAAGLLFLLLRPIFLPLGILGGLALLGAGAALAFLPARRIGPLPGPRQTVSDNPYDLPIMLDEWILLLFRRSRTPKHFPWGGGRG